MLCGNSRSSYLEIHIKEEPMSIYESLARGLNEAIEYEKGTIALRSNTITILDPEEFSANDIKTIRHRTGLSQATFAAAMGVSKKAVEAWEGGRNKPVGTAKRLLAFADEDPKFFENVGIVEYDEVHESRNPVVISRAESVHTVIYTAPNFSKMPLIATGV